MPKFKNINGTSKNKCKCGSWMKHWYKETNKRTSVCSVYGCTIKEGLHGAHVQKTTRDMSWYIVPLCPEHNKAKGKLVVNQNTLFISANQTYTCG